MLVMEIGFCFVVFFNEGKIEDCFNEFYGDNIVSIEGQGIEEMLVCMEGIEVIKGKNQWWYENNEVYSIMVIGFFVGGYENCFLVKFDFDVMFKGGE